MKKPLLSLPLAMFALCIARPAAAVNFPDIDWIDPVSSVIDGVVTEYVGLNDWVRGAIFDQLGDASPYLEPFVDDALGVLGLPDPTYVHAEIEAIAAELPGFLNIDFDSQVLDLENEVNRHAVEAYGQTILSTEGQQRLLDKADAIEYVAQQSVYQADVAANAQSTQDAIKAISQQNANTGALLGTIEAELMQGRVDNQLTNLTLSNISETVDQERRARLQQTAANTTGLQLDAASADLR